MKSKMCEAERIMGKPARFYVYYRRNGKLYFDALWSATADAAASDFKALAKEVGWKKVEVDRVVEIGE